MNNLAIDFALDSNVLKKIPFDKYAKDFTFIVNDKQFRTTRFLADILSPIIRGKHYSDPSEDFFVIKIDSDENHPENYFSDFLNLFHENTPIDSVRQKLYLQYFCHLGNLEGFYNIQRNFLSTLTIENSIERLEAIASASNDYGQQPIREIIEFISKNFEEVNKEALKKLNIEILDLILSNESLKLNEEDSLLNFVLSLYKTDEKYSQLFEYVVFSNVSENSLLSFISQFEVQFISQGIWKSICDRLMNSVKKCENIDKNRYTFELLRFQYDQSKKFNGILNFLRRNKDEIKITTNSIYGGNGPENVIEYEDSKKFYHSKDSDEAVLTFEFMNYFVQISSYEIESGNYSDGGANLKNWVIEVSDDGETWSAIDKHENDATLDGHSLTANFIVKNSDAKYHRFVRFRHFGESWWGNEDKSIMINSFEFYCNARKINK